MTRDIAVSVETRHSATRVGSGLTYYLLLISLVVLIPFLFWSNITGHFSAAFFVTALITFYSGYKISNLAFERSSRLLQLTFWIFVYCWFGLAASGQILGHSFPWGDDVQSDSNLLFSTFVVIAGLLGYELAVRRDHGRRKDRYRFRILSAPSLNRFVIVTVGSVLVSLISLELQGGLSAAFHTRSDAKQEASLSDSPKGSALLEGALQHTPPVIALLVTIYLLLFGRYRGSRRQLFTGTLVTLFLYNLVANFPPSLARVNLGSDIMGVLLLFIHRRAKWKPFFALAMVLILVIVFPYLDYFRTDEGYSADDLRNPATVLVTKSDYDAFQMLSSTIASVSVNSIDYGYHLLGSALFFVPRALWEQKPYGTGQTVGEGLGYVNVNLSCPLWAELYYGFGLPGVLVGFWLFGALSSRYERSVIANPSGVASIWLCYLAGFQIFLLRGDLMNALAYLAPSAVVLPFYLLRLKQQ